VFYADSIDGDYTLHARFRPPSNMFRDDNLFKDSAGAAYFVSAANENADMIIDPLTVDDLDIEGQVATSWAGSYREAPAPLKNGYIYIS